MSCSMVLKQVSLGRLQRRIKSFGGWFTLVCRELCRGPHKHQIKQHCQTISNHLRLIRSTAGVCPILSLMQRQAEFSEVATGQQC